MSMDIKKEKMMAELICLRKFPHRPEAEAVKALLESKGIQAEVLDDEHGSMTPFAAPAAHACLMVSKSELKVSDAVLKHNKVDDEAGMRFIVKRFLEPT